MKALFDAILFAVGVTLPSVLLLGFGVVMRRTGQVDAAFAAEASRVGLHYGAAAPVESLASSSRLLIREAWGAQDSGFAVGLPLGLQPGDQDMRKRSS